MRPTQKYFRFLMVGLTLLVLGFAASKTNARQMQPDNSYVSLDLPTAFKPQSHFSGYVSNTSGATITVLDLPLEAYAQFTHRFDKELDKKGFQVVRHGKLPGRHDEHLFFYTRQHTPVGQFDKFLLIFHNGQRSAYVTITINPIDKIEIPLSYISAQNILRSATLTNRRTAKNKIYDLAYLGAFRERNMIAGSTTIFTLKQKNNRRKNSLKSGKPMFVIAPSLSRFSLRNLQETGRELMTKFSRFRDMKLQADEDITIDGMKGYGLSGTAINKSNNRRVGVYQLILKNPQGGYFRLVGVAPDKIFHHYLLEFRRMAASFRRLSQS